MATPTILTRTVTHPRRQPLPEIGSHESEELVTKRKLIEVALPLEAINRESAREKSIRHGHPSTLHLWWARRPLAAARAVLFAQLVDDPSSLPEEFPTEELQRQERDRLHNLIERLVSWDNIGDEKLFAEAHREILKSTNDNPPPILDPFAGGGTIPLEAQRLGLEAYASDLNPVAVLINKALIEFPSQFRDQPPIFPGLVDSQIRDWRRTEGLAADVSAYGRWMNDAARQRIGHLYPPAILDNGMKAVVIAWIWARTVQCPNPACGIEMPLVRSWWLGKKKDREAYVVPRVVPDKGHPSGLKVTFEIGNDPIHAPTVDTDGTIGRNGARCVACDAPAQLEYVRSASRDSGLGHQLMAVVAEGTRRRLYLAPDEIQEKSGEVAQPDDIPPGEVFDWPGRINVYRYGLTKFTDLFTNRQLVALTTFSDLVTEAREKVISDGGSPAYADSVATYLGLWIDRILNRSTALNIWNTGGEKIEQLFARNAIPMMWNYPEANIFSESSGNAMGQLVYLTNSILELPAGRPGVVSQADAATRPMAGAIIATDPPYYDNIGYSDLSDFFYVWLRRALRAVHPDLLSTMLVPKAEELVANPYRHDGRLGAKEFFETGFRSVFARAREAANPEFPITVWYAFKQSEANDAGEASTGWETLLEGMIRSNWHITSTWPMRSERIGRMGSNGTNALASAIVLSLRPRLDTAPTTDRRGFIDALERELPDALRRLQQGQIAPVDLPQAAIGPGMAVFSRYSAVLEPDGKKMTVRSALTRINEILDHVLNEQEGDFDSTSRFAIAWYRQYGYGTGKFGDADNLARARNTSVEILDREKILTSRAGSVHLIKPTELSHSYEIAETTTTSIWEVLHHLIRMLETKGIPSAGELLRSILAHPSASIDTDLVKELAHLLFRISEGNNWTKDGTSFNTLVTSWPEIIEVAYAQRKEIPSQSYFDFEDNE